MSQFEDGLETCMHFFYGLLYSSIPFSRIGKLMPNRNLFNWWWWVCSVLSGD